LWKNVDLNRGRLELKELKKCQLEQMSTGKNGARIRC
jgi:hypothetical protein